MKVYVLCFCSHGFIWLLQERIIIVLFRLEEVYLQLFLCLNFMIMATAQVTEKEMNPKDDDQYKVVESFLAVNWAVKDDTHYILVGRLMCIIQCFSCLIFDLQTLCGHDDSINDIQCSPYDDALVVSASEDKTFFCRSNKFYLFYSGYHEAKKWTKKNYKTQKGKQVGEPISLERISVSSIDCVSCLQTQVLSQIGEAGLIV
ncbi:hypothetical protein HID58_012593 [Brassica napus]|uniref:Uncharacterized protein n=1 Tax=Brassica napus TaxID=3708 RepID=A0ABQ8E1I0_BRANA|nr:hypothetical protein HID58_012593 [Brassica napus]